MAFPDKSRVIILAPLVTNRKGEHKKILEQLQREGFVRVRINGEIQDLSSSIMLDKNKKHTIEAVVDRLVVHTKMKNRLTDSVELGLHLSGGSLVAWHNMEHEFFFSENAACHDCGISYPELSPQMFSFNSPLGACPKCDGLGTLTEFDPDRIVPDKTKTLREGAIAPWANRLTSFFQQRLTALVRNYGCDKDTPFEELPQSLQKIIIYGTDGLSAAPEFQKEGSNYSFGRFFEGVVNFLKRRYQETESFSRRQEIERYMTVLPCPGCSGARLRKESLSIRVGGHTIAELTASTVEQSSELFNALPLARQEQKIARRILKEIQDRLNFLINVGLNYLTLNRSSTTLSGGEGQRIRLATQIGSRLAGVLYVLDEPSIGLHQRDNRRLLQSLTSMRDLGNTILVVEHDAETILAADYVIDMGPGAGGNGGEVVFSGSPKQILKSRNSLTGKYLSGRYTIPVPEKRRPRRNGFLTLQGARENNLKNIEVSFPLGTFTCVTGVSGSGKSSLVNLTLYRYLAQKLYRAKEQPGKVDGVTGIDLIDKVINIDQNPIGRTPRSNPATYTGLFTPDTRTLFRGSRSENARLQTRTFQFQRQGRPL